jgi:REP element-mobilizing transposase RayT
MKYDPEKHHRRSIRLKGYDYSSAGSYFITICTYQRECLLVLKDNRDVFRDRNDGVGAGFADDLLPLTENLSTKPAPTENLAIIQNHGISEIIRGFKTFSARRINQIRHTPGIPVWQRNYYEHIVRDESSFQKIRQYIQTNPIAWEIDRLHPDNPSKW